MPMVQANGRTVEWTPKDYVEIPPSLRDDEQNRQYVQTPQRFWVDGVEVTQDEAAVVIEEMINTESNDDSV